MSLCSFFYRPETRLISMFRKNDAHTDIFSYLNKLHGTSTCAALLNTAGKKKETALHLAWRRYRQTLTDSQDPALTEEQRRLSKQKTEENFQLLEALIKRGADPLLMDAENISVLESALYFNPDNDRALDLFFTHGRFLQSMGKERLDRLIAMNRHKMIHMIKKYFFHDFLQGEKEHIPPPCFLNILAQMQKKQDTFLEKPGKQHALLIKPVLLQLTTATQKKQHVLLTKAIQDRSSRAVENLCIQMADSAAVINTQDEEGRTLLHAALDNATIKDIGLITLLTIHDADFNIPDRKGITPQMLFNENILDPLQKKEQTEKIVHAALATPLQPRPQLLQEIPLERSIDTRTNHRPARLRTCSFNFWSAATTTFDTIAGWFDSPSQTQKRKIKAM